MRRDEPGKRMLWGIGTTIIVHATLLIALSSSPQPGALSGDDSAGDIELSLGLPGGTSDAPSALPSSASEPIAPPVASVPKPAPSVARLSPPPKSKKLVRSRPIRVASAKRSQSPVKTKPIARPPVTSVAVANSASLKRKLSTSAPSDKKSHVDASRSPLADGHVDDDDIVTNSSVAVVPSTRSKRHSLADTDGGEGTNKPLVPPVPPAGADVASAGSGGSGGGGSRGARRGKPMRDAEPISQSAPTLPDALRHDDFSSVIGVTFVVAANGKTQVSLQSTSGNAQIDARVLAAMRRWKWKPALKKGIPIASVRTLQIEIVVD